MRQVYRTVHHDGMVEFTDYALPNTESEVYVDRESYDTLKAQADELAGSIEALRDWDEEMQGDPVWDIWPRIHEALKNYRGERD